MNRDSEARRVSAIILSGGSGTRLSQYGIPKQFIEVVGAPLFIHCLRIYEQLDEVDDVVLVINQAYEQLYLEILDKFPVKKVRCLVGGGRLRHESIRNGLARINHSGLIVIQNGVNPTTPPHTIRACIQEASTCDAVTAYVSAFHTVFEKEGDQLIRTLERKNLGYTSDPQVFSVSVLQRALLSAEEGVLTDLPMVDLVRKLGCEVRLVKSDEENLKVSTEVDLYATEMILSKIGGGI